MAPILLVPDQSGAAPVFSDAGRAPVLAVDLDGTLLRSDLLWESLLGYVLPAPWRIMSAILWLGRGGRAQLKAKLAESATLVGPDLPWNHEIVAWCESSAARGVTVVVATAANETLASGVTRHFNFVSRVIGSDGSCNLKADEKAKRLVGEFGAGGFDYIGDSAADLPVWRVAKHALFIGEQKYWREFSGKLDKPLTQIEGEKYSPLHQVVTAMRPHQWLKNLLVFFPLLAAHRWADLEAWKHVGPVFVALCCMASASYLLNDLSDLAADRRHPRKKFRPFAAGYLTIPQGILAVLALLLVGGVLAASAGWSALAATFLYFVLSTTYSLALKAIPVVDTVVLSGLYTYRMVLGGIAGSVMISPWLLAFSTTFFLGLALLKRFVELDALPADAIEAVPGRGYTLRDRTFVLVTGVSSNFLSVVVLALYLESSASRALYVSPPWLWGIALVLLFWIIRVWFLAGRKQMHDDPVWFAAKDWVTFALGLVCLAMIAAAGPA